MVRYVVTWHGKHWEARYRVYKTKKAAIRQAKFLDSLGSMSVQITRYQMKSIEHLEPVIFNKEDLAGLSKFLTKYGS